MYKQSVFADKRVAEELFALSRLPWGLRHLLKKQLMQKLTKLQAQIDAHNEALKAA